MFEPAPPELRACKLLAANQSLAGLLLTRDIFFFFPPFVENILRTLFPVRNISRRVIIPIVDCFILHRCRLRSTGSGIPELLDDF